MRDYSENLKLLKNTTGELWKVSTVFPDYAASTNGRIMRLTFGGSNATKPGKILGGHNLQHTGYVRISLYRGKKCHYLQLHRFVLETFVGPAPTNKHVGAHWDNNRQNNALGNLRWATQRENAADKNRHGTQPRGVHHKNASLTEIQLKAIRKIAARGIGKLSLAAAVGIGGATMSRLLKGETYK